MFQNYAKKVGNYDVAIVEVTQKFVIIESEGENQRGRSRSRFAGGGVGGGESA
jgi:hypothetical protein